MHCQEINYKDLVKNKPYELAEGTYVDIMVELVELEAPLIGPCPSGFASTNNPPV